MARLSVGPRLSPKHACLQRRQGQRHKKGVFCIDARGSPSISHDQRHKQKVSYNAGSTPGRRPGSYFVAEAEHAVPVLLDERPAVGGRVGGGGEEHALVAPRLLLLADAARLRRGVRGGRRGGTGPSVSVSPGPLRATGAGRLTLGREALSAEAPAAAGAGAGTVRAGVSGSGTSKIKGGDAAEREGFEGGKGLGVPTAAALASSMGRPRKPTRPGRVAGIRVGCGPCPPSTLLSALW